HDAKHGGERDGREPDLLFGADAGHPDAADRAAICFIASRAVALDDSAGPWPVWRSRSLSADPGLQAGHDPRSGALSLSADGLDDCFRLLCLWPISRWLDAC